MAGTIIESQLTAPASSAVRFVLATREDDAAIRRLLRENALNGEISLTFEREPNYFDGSQIAGADDQTFLAFENGRLVCMGRCSIRDRYINGEVRRVGYLSDLRLDASERGRFDLLRRGYHFFRDLQLNHPADFYFTSITADNVRSLRFLERGLPGMPVYKPIADFVTLLIPVVARAGRRFDSKKYTHRMPVPLSTVLEFLNSQARQYNLAAVWDEEKIHSSQHHGLPLANFQWLMDGEKIVACSALWDQRSFKQIVIRGYSPRLALVRPGLNFVAAALGGPKLPPIGSTLAHGFLSPLATLQNDHQSLLAIIESSFPIAAQCGLDFITVGFAADDPRLAGVRSRFRCREYVNRLFQIYWKDEDSARIALNGGLVFPEVALL